MKKQPKYDANTINRRLFEMFKGNEVMRWQVYNLIEAVRRYEREQLTKTTKSA